MNPNFETIDALKAEWDDLQPLAPENEQRLWKKLRLEWNYHSNHIEGNTLTYGETELLLLHDQTHGNHTLREYEEMKAHDVGIAHLLTLAEDKARLIGESDIRDLNKLILKEPFWKPAQTADGKPSRKQIIPGDYKTTPNNVLTATGEMFEFAPPTEVPVRMERLVKWLDASLTAGTIHPVMIAAKLHHDFVLIHPFDDGNGRVARMLVNYLFMRLGYPPIIVPTERKKDYLVALRLADAGDILELVDFIGSCLTRSLELGTKAAKGASVEEPGDVEKEVALFVKSRTIKPMPEVSRSTAVVAELHQENFRYLLGQMQEKVGMFRPLFARVTLFTEPLGTQVDGSTVAAFDYCMAEGVEKISWIMWDFEFDGYLGESGVPFGIDVPIMLNMDELEFVWRINDLPVLRKPYSEPTTKAEADLFVEQVLKFILDAITKETEKT